MRPAVPPSPLVLAAALVATLHGTPAGATPTAPQPSDAPLSAATAPQRPAAPLAAALTADAETAARWVVEAGDNAGRPFAIVDKRAAQLALFGPDGRLLGAAPALLGLAAGDTAVPGLGALEPADIPPAERTTPAGRFASEPGRNLGGEDVVWFDYEAGLAIHRLRPGFSEAPRQQRLASPDPQDNRVSFGCVVVAPDFYETRVQPLLGRQRGLVYVLPETQPAQAWLQRLGDRSLAVRAPR